MNNFSFDCLSYKEVHDKDFKYIKKIINEIFNDLSYDSDYAGWVINGYQYLPEFFFEEYNTFLNPKDLEGDMDYIIEDIIAKNISELEDLPNNDSFYKSCVKVAKDLYDVDYQTACRIADLIQKKYLR